MQSLHHRIYPSMKPLLTKIINTCSAFMLSAGLISQAQTQTPPPKTWIDPDTGHRVIRLTDEPGSASFYFTDNGYTSDGKYLVYTTPGAISALNLKTYETHVIVKGVARAIVVGRKTPTVFYTKTTDKRGFLELWSANIETNQTQKLASLPQRGSIVTINADETLAVGSYIEGAGLDYGSNGGNSQGSQQPHVLDQPVNKSQMMATRLAARLPMWIYTVDLKTGQSHNLLHGTDWLNHMQFSPTDPNLLMYCHEGAWHQVDRIWTIRTDGTQNQLIHKRIMEMEISGHEWWSHDGNWIWYDLQLPKRINGYVAGYNISTHERIWYHHEVSEDSIHYNSSWDGSLFCGDGSQSPGAQWIYLFRPVHLHNDHTLGENLILAGKFEAEKLVNMSKHHYRLEPNVSFTPDMKFVVFRSNMFGSTYPFAVEVAKAATP